MDKKESKLIINGFRLACVANIAGVLLFSKCFTNTTLNNGDPIVMSNFGLLMIIVWGLAYFSVARIYKSVKWLVGVFFIEKLVYVIAWGYWQMNNELSALYDKDLFAGMFYSIYGINDLFFMCFFGWVFVKTSKEKSVL